MTRFQKTYMTTLRRNLRIRFKTTITSLSLLIFSIIVLCWMSRRMRKYWWSKKESESENLAKSVLDDFVSKVEKKKKKSRKKMSKILNEFLDRNTSILRHWVWFQRWFWSNWNLKRVLEQLRRRRRREILVIEDIEIDLKNRVSDMMKKFRRVIRMTRRSLRSWRRLRSLE